MRIVQALRAIRLIYLWIVSVFGKSIAAPGFCMDNIPVELEDTGFAGVSNLTQQDCISAGHEWCPASARIEVHQLEDGQSVDYYRFSACCSGRQKQNLIVDSTGLPTCDANSRATKCTRLDWSNKLFNDLVGEESGYNFEVAASNVVMDESVPGGFNSSIQCVCSADDPRCVIKSGTKCLVCENYEKCGDYAVSLGINFFKIHTVDLKSSLLVMSSWLRQSWTDPRLAWNPQCYGGMDFTEFNAEAGSLENSRIWTPDIEMYNAEENIWQGSFSARLAIVYSGPSAPSTSKGGSVFWSRPGLLKSMCKFNGLSMFPHDVLSCELEFAAWAIDGRFQDVVVYGKDGVTWMGKEDSLAVAGLTAGASEYQDYKIFNITSKRYSVFYDCCPNAPFPEIIFKVSIQRANNYYIFKLVIPGIGLTLISFITFWMNPAIGERLGFAITVILAMVAQEITAADLMPVCNFRVLLDYLSVVSLMFGGVSVVETGIVLYLYHQEEDSWMDVLLPQFLESLIVHRLVGKAETKGSKKRGLQQALTKPRLSLNANKKEKKKKKEDLRIRKQLYRQLFFVLDKDFSGSLNLEEIADFLETVGAEHQTERAAIDALSTANAAKFCKSISKVAFAETEVSMNHTHPTDHLDSLREFMAEYDVNADATLDFDEFTKFCDLEFSAQDDLKYISKVIHGFLQVVERRRAACIAMWRTRALMVDQFARWTVPGGFVMFLSWLYSLDAEDMHELMKSSGQQYIFTIAGVLPLAAAVLCCIVFWFVRAILQRQKRRRNALEAAKRAAMDLEGGTRDNLVPPEPNECEDEVSQNWVFVLPSSASETPSAVGNQHAVD